MANINTNKLVTTVRNLEKYRSDLNPNDIELWKQSVSAIEILAEDFVAVAMRIASLLPDSIYIFDLDEAAGTEIHSLMRGLFETNLNGLTAPNDDELIDALSLIGINNLSKENRNNFYKVWAGEEAVNSISFLTKFLSGAAEEFKNSDECIVQKNRLEKLLKINLPDSVKNDLKFLF
jgi:hypothetical protein